MCIWICVYIKINWGFCLGRWGFARIRFLLDSWMAPRIGLRDMAQVSRALKVLQRPRGNVEEPRAMIGWLHDWDALKSSGVLETKKGNPKISDLRIKPGIPEMQFFHGFLGCHGVATPRSKAGPNVVAPTWGASCVAESAGRSLFFMAKMPGA